MWFFLLSLYVVQCVYILITFYTDGPATTQNQVPSNSSKEPRTGVAGVHGHLHSLLIEGCFSPCIIIKYLFNQGDTHLELIKAQTMVVDVMCNFLLSNSQ